MKKIFTTSILMLLSIIVIAQPCTNVEEFNRKKHRVGGTYGHPYTMFDKHNGKTFDFTIKDIRKRIINEFHPANPGPVCAAYQQVYNNAVGAMPKDDGMMTADGNVSDLALWAKNNAFVFLTDVDTTLRDFYWRYDRGLEPYDSVTKQPAMAMPAAEGLSDGEKAKYASANLYEVSFINKGGLVMPIILEFTFEDGTKETQRLPAQIWRKNENKVTKVFLTSKKAVSIQLDPMRETADIDESNNKWPNVAAPSKFALFKSKGFTRGQSIGLSPMAASQNKK